MSKCRHRKTWLICSAHWEWCWACGAIRQMETHPTKNHCWPKSQWQRPVGRDAENPWPPKLRRDIKEDNQ